MLHSARYAAIVAALLSCISCTAAPPAPSAVDSLNKWLATPVAARPALADQAFARTALTKAEAAAAHNALWRDHVARVRAEREAEMKEHVITMGELRMPFAYTIFGDKPATGRSLFISLHGGGNAPKAVNDQQWRNQIHLYQPKEGVYLAPRAPTDTWNLWHQAHIDAMFDRLIEDLIVFEDVDPNHVYVMGYSAGGDGVYQLGPRMADRWAAAAMMAGHPNEASPLALRNVPFAIHVGALDAGYGRNDVAKQWGAKLDALQKDDPTGYVHHVELHPGKGHWMDREDAVAVEWMAQYTRDPLPMRVVWKQDDVTHTRFYWLAVPPEQAKTGAEIIATRQGQRIDLAPQDADEMTVRLSDAMLDLDQPVVIAWSGKVVYEARAARSIAVIARTIEERGDPTSVFCAEVTVKRPTTK